MTLSIYDGTGNLIDAFDDRGAALRCLADLVQTNVDQGFLVAQDDCGAIVGEILFASELHARERACKAAAAST
jgi:hypothetical protein